MEVFISMRQTLAGNELQSGKFHVGFYFYRANWSTFHVIFLFGTHVFFSRDATMRVAWNTAEMAKINAMITFFKRKEYSRFSE
jgi:hypothetical protein